MTGNSGQQLATHATEHFMKVLETEVHEKTLIFALEMLSKWGSKFTQVPKKLIDWFEKGMGVYFLTLYVFNNLVPCQVATKICLPIQFNIFFLFAFSI